MDLLVVLTFFVMLVAGLLSGMSGGGGGFLSIPYLIAIGLPPANALATGKLGGIGTTAGALVAFNGKGLVNKKYVVPFMIITLVCALISAWLIPRIDAEFFQNAIGGILLLLIPTLFINKAAFKPGTRTGPWVTAGFIAYALFSFAQTLFGTGIGTLLILVLMYLFGMNALQANATKRVAQSVQSVVLLVLLGIQGLVVWAHGIAGLLGALIGTHIGSRIALKKGNNFVKFVLAAVMAVSGVILLIF